VKRRLAAALALTGAVTFAACSPATPTPTPGLTASPETAVASPSATPTPASGLPPTAASVVDTPVPSAPVATAAPTRVPTASPGPVLATPSPVEGELEDIEVTRGGQLVGLDDVALGDLVPASESASSVCFAGGDYGSPFSETSILNPDSVYGGPFGEQSPFNPDASSPPSIVVEGSVIGSLSVSPFVANAVDPRAALTALGCPELLP
jgi:hypothetical protein